MSTAEAAAPASAPPNPPAAQADKPAHDVVAGAFARAASQSTIHPLDTLKVRMQAGNVPKGSSSGGSAVVPAGLGLRGFRVNAAGVEAISVPWHRALAEVASLYKGVVGAATGAGVIIGTYFAFYSTTKNFLRERTRLPEGSVAFVAGATAAVGSSFVKVPIAVCVRSVQAGVYPNALAAARSIARAAGPRGLFTGFWPTLLEDAPDMAVKFAAYETLRLSHQQLNSRQPSTLEELVMGGVAGAAAAAATTPLDVVKTRMMCAASHRPSVAAAVRSVLSERRGAAAFFTGVGPRALSNGLNSALFFCFFEAIRRVLQDWAPPEDQWAAAPQLLDSATPLVMEVDGGAAAARTGAGRQGGSGAAPTAVASITMNAPCTSRLLALACARTEG